MRHQAKSGMLVIAFSLLLLLSPALVRPAMADQLVPAFSSTDGSECANLSDETFSTTEHYEGGTEITLSADEAIDALYILWEDVPTPWQLKVGAKEYACGKDGYLHEYVKIPADASGAKEATIVIPEGGATIADVYALSAGTLPAFVQVWEPSYEKADILFVSTHADDECLFLGGAIPTYCNRPDVRVQVAYFCDFWQTEAYRNHEILNGLWVMGVTHYPQLGEFIDKYCETLDQASAIYDYDESLEYLVRTLRRFKPQVVVGQDIIAGEYGHGAHMWSAKMIADALEPAADEGKYEASAKKYGTWSVPKTYFHLYPEGELEIDARVPLENLGGSTALDLAKASYLQHLSQQYTWFYVDDGYDENGEPNDYAYSCAKFGLYNSSVGDDTGKQDMLENITTYDEQEAKEAAEREAAEAKAKEAEKAAQEQEAQEVAAVAERSRQADLLVVVVVVGFVVVAFVVALLTVFIRRRRRRRRYREQQAQRRRPQGRRPQERQGQRSQGQRRRPQGKRPQKSSR